MAVNFEATFVQPLLAQLDAGNIGDAKQWANAITDLYIASIKLGLPGGVPVTLPAPGLNPTGPPPPFPIGTVGFVNAETRKKQMYNIIYAYFLAKQLSLQKSSIDNLAEVIQSLVRRIKTVQRQIRTLNDQAKQVSRELSQLPTLIRDIYTEIKSLISKQIDDIESLIETTREGEFGGISREEFRQIFAAELRMVSTLKNFDVNNPASIREVANLVSSQTSRLNQRLQSPNREELIRRDLTNRLVRLANDALRYLQIPVSPSSFIDFANNIKRQGRRFQRLADRIIRIDFIVRFVKPKYERLKARVIERVTYLRKKLQAKLKALSEERKKRIAERELQKGESKRDGIFVKAKKALKDFANWNKKWLKKYGAKLKLTSKIISKLVRLSSKVAAMVFTLIEDFKQLKPLILRLRDRALRVQQSIDGLADQSDQNANRLNQERLKLSDYLNGLGFPMLVQIGSNIINETLCTARDVIFLFERRAAKYRRFVEELGGFGDELRSIQIDIRNLFTTEEGRARREERRTLRANKRLLEKGRHETWIGARITSLKDVFVRMFYWIKPKVEKALNWVKTFFKKTKNYVTRTAKKFAAQLEEYALALVPLKSEVEDPKNKKDILEAKRQVVRDTKKAIKKYIKRLKAAQKVVPASVQLVTNLENGKFSLNQNSQAINRIADGVYDYKSFEKEPHVKQQMHLEKEKFKNDFLTLTVAEAVIVLLRTIAVGIVKDGQIRTEWQKLKRDLNDLATSLEPSQIATVAFVTSFIESPPKNPNLRDVTSLSNLGSNAFLNDKRVIQRLAQFEAKYRRKIIQSFDTVLQNPAISKRIEQIENPSPSTVGDPTISKSTLFYEAYLGLKKLRDSVYKQGSLILALMRFLGSLVIKLFKWIGKHVTRWYRGVKAYIKRQIEKKKKEQVDEVEERNKKRTNPDAFAMSVMFGLAARAFWTGARWVGPTQTQFTSLTIGGFRPRMKARIEDGATGFLREMARGFQAQLVGMKGVVTPPANTGIASFPFSSYT